MQPARPRRNRIAIGLPIYRNVSEAWFLAWCTFEAQIAAYDRMAGVHKESGAAVEFAMNEIVRKMLIKNYEQMRPSEVLGYMHPRVERLVKHRNPEIREIGKALVEALTVHLFDYLLFIESDNTMPEGLLERIATLDPDTHKIVGFPYCGRSTDDQRPIPGDWDKAGNWSRLSYERFKAMMDNPGFHEVGSVGMGCTAIHRSVFEKWPDERFSAWFHPVVEKGMYVGHDVTFCYEAKKFGVVDKVWLNTELESGHIGDWISTSKSYFANHEFVLRALEGKVEAETARGAHVVVPHTENGLREETMQAVDLSKIPAQYVNTGEADSDYHDLLADEWANGKTFITVEQDIVPFETAIEQLLACDQPWCGYEYEYPPFPFKYAGLGCTKFSAELIARHPTALAETAKWSDPKHPPKHWCRVDGYLKQYLAERGEKMHIHGEVRHLTKGGTGHGCTSAEEAMDIARAQGFAA